MVKRSDRKEERHKRNKLTAAAPATMFNKKSPSLFVPNQFVPLSGMLCPPLGLSPKCHVRFLQLFGVYGGIIILFFYQRIKLWLWVPLVPIQQRISQDPITGCQEFGPVYNGSKWMASQVENEVWKHLSAPSAHVCIG